MDILRVIVKLFHHNKKADLVGIDRHMTVIINDMIIVMSISCTEKGNAAKHLRWLSFIGSIWSFQENDQNHARMGLDFLLVLHTQGFFGDNERVTLKQHIPLDVKGKVLLYHYSLMKRQGLDRRKFPLNFTF